MGNLHYKLRILGRYRALRYAYLGGVVPLQSSLPSAHLPSRRGDDGIRGYDGRIVSDYPLGSSVVRVVVDAVPEPTRPVAELSFATFVGRVRGFDLLHYFGDLLLRWSHPGYRGRS